MGLARFWFGSHLSTPSRSFVPPTQNIQPCSANGRGAGKSRRRTAAARKVSKHRSRREEGGGPTNVGGTAGSAGGREGRKEREEGGSQPTGHLSEAPIKYPAKNISRDLWLLSKGENTLEKLSQTLQAAEASERESEEEAGGAQTQPRADRHAARSLPLLHEPTFGKCSLPPSLPRFFL